MNLDEQIKTKLKHNIVLLILTQDELNLFSEIEESIKEDCLYINEPYIAFKDSDSAIQLLPQSNIDDSFPNEFKKPRKFMSWYRSVKNKRENTL